MENEISLALFGVASAGGIWFLFIVVVQAIGTLQLYRRYSARPIPAVSPTQNIDYVPHITILRPVKGLEPQLYECLAATFHQTYPLERLTIYFCVASSADPAYPVLQRLLSDFPEFDARIFVEEEDPNLSGKGKHTNLGPNPKIRNMSRGYREAKGDLVWIVDCNVWVGRGVAGRMVDKLCGYTHDGKPATPYKFVHQLPLVVDSVGASASEEARGLLQGLGCERSTTSTSPPVDESSFSRLIRTSGGRLEEMFMATSHAKFYTAISTVSVAPCIVGKSNMFRRSHLNALTTSPVNKYSPGIDFFSENICEDHLIGDLLWRNRIPDVLSNGQRFKNHGLVFGDLAIQPMANMSLSEYIARRVRWLRVRKWTVMLATFVEPGVEPLLCSAYGAFAISTLPYFPFPHTWLSFSIAWLSIILLWMKVDSLVYAKVHSGSGLELDADTPSFARPPASGSRRGMWEWIAAWLGREVLALPIWTWACYGGTTVVWRGKKFRVGLDMKVREISKTQEGRGTPMLERARCRDSMQSKSRVD
ncbi:uncharacterized protein L3040_002631 [Drepanopeziza brunnea f. sp. 'multigermtubi']|uniref:Ceramide glucosyltransferase n=1 Tax=Marssonina brunnea f. sp. multigermtubi (strain MB_m1) TaxID=1072389 RepID=K1X382_MARBU|nr:ceramide glucosyltransferase [Drepanopeziza brunnea f. sp. 'multigermtubi' MB_m1]EKD19492.1 ceramide glucosyltransferase [Drepanopeziza brunnea f. sp. 'multigermtubi' MB_m1]KAJ5050760.1 hypothetical protein L3040_002631 [Drepanopeziza brunnea f. sp. 'multigermtubi']